MAAYERDVAPVFACMMRHGEGVFTSSAQVGVATAATHWMANATSAHSSQLATSIDVRVTKHRGEAHAAAASIDLDAYAAIVCVGGDGTLAEVIPGLGLRV